MCLSICPSVWVLRSSPVHICVVEFAQQYGRHEQSSRHPAGRRRDGRQLFKPIPKWKCEYNIVQHNSRSSLTPKLIMCNTTVSPPSGMSLTYTDPCTLDDCTSQLSMASWAWFHTDRRCAKLSSTWQSRAGLVKLRHFQTKYMSESKCANLLL